jgi:hypothetical protein
MSIPSYYQGVWLSHFHIFADESGKLKKSDYTSMCGYLGHEIEWERFREVWDTCRLKWRVPPLHMARLMNPQHKDDGWRRVFETWGADWEDKRNHMLSEFGEIVNRSGIVGIGRVLDTQKYRELQAADRLPGTNDPNVFTFQSIVMRSIERAKEVVPNATVTLIIDDDPENAWGYYNLLNSLKRHSDQQFSGVKDQVDAICFGDDRFFPGLQAADLLSYASRDYMVARSTASEPKWPLDLYKRLTQHGINQPELYDAEFLERLANSTTQKTEGARKANEA